MKNLIVLISILFFSAGIIADADAAKEHQRFTGTGAVNISATPGSTNADGFEVRLHLSATAASGTLLVGVGSLGGSTYDCNLETYAMSGVKDYAREFDNRIKAGDTVRIQWDNAGGATWGIEVIWE